MALRLALKKFKFLSTLPARGATGGEGGPCGGHKEFLSTLPARGATWGEHPEMEDMYQFLSTLPARGATWFSPPYLCHLSISIHAPREGSDLSSPPNVGIGPISIHAPREGSDKGRIRPGQLIGDFYPRSPRGERLNDQFSTRFKGVISIHAPREGSDLRTCSGSIRPLPFLSTLPARGATGLASPPRAFLGRFLSTLPARGATAGHR